MNVSDSSTSVDPAWWARPELREALATRDIAAIYHFLRGRGFSQARIAALSGQNQSEVSAILAHGRQVTAYDVLARIADGLQIPRGFMGLAYTQTEPAPIPDTTEGRHVRRRNFMGIAAKITMGAGLAATDLAMLAAPAAAAPTPDHLGMGDVQRIEEMTAALDKQDLAFGGGSCREAIVGYLNWAIRLRNATMTDEVRRALDMALAHLEELAGWASYDLQLHDAAERFYLRALHSARLADYPFMAAKALARMGKLYLEDGQPADALRMFHLATVPAREAASIRMAVYLHLMEARVHALRGNPTATYDAIHRAQDDYANVETDAPARQTRFLVDCTLHNEIASAHSDLATHDAQHAAQAVEAAAVAARQSVDGPRTQLLHLTPLALNAYRIGDLDRANEATGQIVDALPTVSSRRLTARLRPLAAEAATHDDSTATDLAHRLSAL